MNFRIILLLHFKDDSILNYKLKYFSVIVNEKIRKIYFFLRIYINLYFDLA